MPVFSADADSLTAIVAMGRWEGKSHSPIVIMVIMMVSMLRLLAAVNLASAVSAFIAPASASFAHRQQNNNEFQLHASADPNKDDDNTSSSAPRICVVGGGFGGLNTALALNDLPWPSDMKPTITLLDKKERFVFLPLLYELCVDDASPEEVAPTFKSLLEGTDIEFVQCGVDGADVTTNTLYTSTKKMPFDAMVIATGADLNLASVPGAEEYAIPFYTIEQCYELRKQFNVLDSISESRKGGNPLKVVIIGGGYSGVEMSLNTLERLGGQDKVEVTLVHRGDEILQYATDFNRKTGQESLKKASIKVMTNTNVVEITSAENIEGQSDNGQKCQVKVTPSTSGDETILEADLLIWTAGATSTNTQRGVLNSILPRDESGRLVTGKLMRVRDTENVFAVGDCSRARQVPYAATAQVAIQQAPVAAWNVFATVMNKRGRRDRSGEEYKLLPFEYLDLGEMMTLGSDDATISSLGGLVQLNGPAASIARRLIYAVRMPTVRQGVTAAVESTGRRVSSARQGRQDQKRRKGKLVDWK